MNPLRSERDAFRLLLLVIGGALGVAAAGALADGWTALAVFLSLVTGVGVGLWVARQRPEGAGGNPGAVADQPARIPGQPVLVVAPSELAGATLAREVVAEECASAVRVVLLASGDALGGTASRAAAELRALFEELGVPAQAISVARADAEKAVAAELRDGVLSHVFIATHRPGHAAFEAEEQLVHAIDEASRIPVVAVAFSAP